MSTISAGIARALYSALWIAITPLVLLRLAWRARRQPEYLQNLGERFGFYPQQQGSAPLLWVHAVSVGETRAALPLVRALLTQYPRHDILLTHMTPTGRATGLELFGTEPRVHSAYLPYEIPVCIARFLRCFKPQIGIVMETEVWPNLLHAAKTAAVPMVLCNARLSERSARGYGRIPALSRPAFGAFAQILAQDEAGAARLRTAGGRDVRVCGNLKFDQPVDEAKVSLGGQFRTMAGDRQIVLAAITREGEEALVFAAFRRAFTGAAGSGAVPLLVVVPRHPQRFNDVAQLARDAGFTLARRSAGGNGIGAEINVWLGDSMGEMQAYFAMADVALIGGSWLPLGGHNLIEACALGTPVILGPHTFNFADASKAAIAAGAALRCADLDEAMQAAKALLQNTAQQAAMQQAGLDFSASHRGATVRYVTEIAKLIE